MTITNYISNSNNELYSIKILEERTSISKNELAYTIRQLNLNPDLWNNRWVLDEEKTTELMNYLLIVYRLKKIRKSRK